jgi:hypothetical protein
MCANSITVLVRLCGNRTAWRRRGVLLRSVASGYADDARPPLRVLAFLYGEADAALREANNAKLHQHEQRYTGLSDRLFLQTSRGWSPPV